MRLQRVGHGLVTEQQQLLFSTPPILPFFFCPNHRHKILVEGPQPDLRVGAWSPPAGRELKFWPGIWIRLSSYSPFLEAQEKVPQCLSFCSWQERSISPPLLLIWSFPSICNLWRPKIFLSVLSILGSEVFFFVSGGEFLRDWILVFKGVSD